MENELAIAQWLMDNAALLLAEYETVSDEMDEYMFLKAVAHQAFYEQMDLDSFEEAFDTQRIETLIDFYFRRKIGKTDSLH